MRTVSSRSCVCGLDCIHSRYAVRASMTTGGDTATSRSNTGQNADGGFWTNLLRINLRQANSSCLSVKARFTKDQDGLPVLL